MTAPDPSNSHAETGDTAAIIRKAATIIQSLERRIQASDAARTEPIAIVGVGCRLPGGVAALAALADLLDAGVDAVGPIPRARFDVERAFDPDPNAPGKTYVREGAFLDAVDRFDPGFFGISPREAAWLDPQHRALVECGWEALEDAGIPPDSLRNTQVGVYVGIGPSDYGQRVVTHAPEALEAYAATGLGMSFSAGRLSFLLGLQGPSLAVDTACSSSLVALHLACLALRAGECALALAGGVQVMLAPEPFILLSRLRALAPDGRCKSFSDRADGYGRGEGCGVVALKRLSDARRDGDRILALIKGTAVNHDGPSSGLTTPNGSAQREVLRRALASAGVAPAEVDYVEAHGTGTPLGDPIEVEALADVYGPGRAAPLGIGTVKTNLGHLESASGIAGVLKVVAALRRGALPASLHAERLSPHLDWAALPVRVVRAREAWPSGARPRRAGVSSFGMNGTNAHAVLEEAPPIAAEPSAAPARPAELVVLSAKTPAALDAVAARLRAHLEAHPGASPGDVAFSLATGRAHHAHRLAIPVASRAALGAALEAVRRGEVPAAAVRGEARFRRGKLAFLFTGQGAQVPGMGRELHEAWPAFREAFDRCVALFNRELPRPLREVIHAAPGSADAAWLDRTAYTQPALFAVEYALFALWRSWGVEPELVAGHSIGELTAACAAGVFSLEDAARLVAARGRLMQALPAGGVMVSIAASEAEVAEAVAPHPEDASIAGVNGPGQVVIAGAERTVEAIAAAFAARGARVKRLAVSHAFHSPLMDPMLSDFRRVAETVTYLAPDRPVVSNVTGAVAGPEIATPGYWVEHVRSAVRFADGVKALRAAGASIFVEIGPKPVLLGLVSACVEGEGEREGEREGKEELETTLVPSLRADRPESEAVLAALGVWYAAGGAIDWKGVFAEGARRVALPAYPWQRERHWVDPVPRGAAPRGAAGLWPLSGMGVRMPGVVLHHVLSVGPRHQPFLGDHVVFGKVVVPGAFHIAVILSIATERWPDRAIELTGVEFLRAIAMEPGDEVEVEVHAVLTPEGDGDGFQFEVATLAGSEAGPETGRGFTVHARGRVRPTDAAAGALPRPEALAERAPRAVDGDTLLQGLSAMRIDWGPLWRWLQEGYVGADAARATLVPTYPSAHGAAPLHPSLLDNGFAVSQQGSISAASDGTPWLPFAVEQLRWWRAPGGRVRCGSVTRPNAVGVSDFVLVDDDGSVVAEVEGFVCRRAPREAFLRRESSASVEGMYRLDWPEAPSSPEASLAPLAGTWVVVAAAGSAVAAALAARLERCVVTEAPGLAAALDHATHATHATPLAGVVCLWEAEPGEEPPAAAQRLATAGLSVVQALRGRAPARLVWVTAGAMPVVRGEAVAVAAASVWGLGRTAMQEHPELGCRLVDLEPDPDAARSADALGRELGRVDDDETQVALRAGKRHVARLVKAKGTEALAVPRTASYRLEIEQRGSFDHLGLAPAERQAPGPGEVEIEVTASGLNFRSVLDALGLYPGDAGPLGGDCAGTVVAVGQGVRHVAVGDAVMAIGAFGRFVTVDARWVARQPAGLSPAQAATVPVAFLTAWLALRELKQLQRGDRVLIHAAAGGVGVAAVQIARWVGAEVFATASPSKWATVEAMGVPRTHLASSRTLEFAEAFRKVSGGRGVDVVLNSLAGEFVDASLSLLSPGGDFIEIGKTDLRDPTAVAVAHPGVRYQAFDILELSPDRNRAILDQVAGAFNAGHLRALPAHPFAITEAEAAFRFMGQARHKGKVVLLPARDGASTAREGTVVVTGGLGALGLHVARWLSREGVAHLVLTGRRGLETPGAAAAVEELQALGARVTVAAVDVADREALAAALEAIPRELPLRGVVHAAGVLDDGMLAEQSAERFAQVLRPKVAGAWNLHQLTAGHDLAFFVMFSSVAGLFGSAGQGNYAAANAFLDALAAHRRALGLTGQSLAWGAWSEGGMAAGLDAAHRARLARQGMGALSAAQGIALLGQALSRPEAHLGVVALDLQAIGRALGGAVPPLWRALVRAPVARPAAAGAKGAWATRLAALPEARRAEEVRAVLQSEIARVLSLADASAVQVDRPLSEMGLDSLMAVELRNALGQRVGTTLPATLAFDYPTVDALGRWLLAEVLKVTGAAALPAKAPLRVALDEPIAILGIGCRYPGGVTDPESFWRLMDEEIDAITEVPPARWDIDAWYDPDPDAPGKMTTRWGGFVPELDRFDPAFFGISPREATSIDPRERMMLEASWEALERAGQTPERLMGSDTAVYMGLCGSEYQVRAMIDARTIDAYALLGTAHSAMVGRLSYFLGLKGPNLAVDTACSSSLVAVHLACQALRQGECGMALAGGANVVLSPEGTVYFSRLKAMSPTGRCHTFSADADGYVRGEGCGVVVLKRLSDAQRDGDPILAVIRGSAINQDGRSQGLTAPNGPSQQAVIRTALSQAGVLPAEVGYVECHGTGTPLGDPIEVQALGVVLGEGRDPARPVILGSVKSNLGHTEGAAGVAGLIKVVLSLIHDKIPRSLHFTKPNPHIAWSDFPVKVASEAVAWPRNGAPRRAGVSSFGFSGTNAHIVLEEATAARPAPEAPLRSAELLALSARSAEALSAQAGRLRDHLESHPGPGLGDVAFSLATGRSPMDHRLAVAASSREGLLAALEAAAKAQTPPGAVRGRALGAAPKVVFVFPGQGSQWVGMGRQLLLEEPVFRAALHACDQAILAEAGFSLLAELAADAAASQMGRIEVVQPVLFAMEVALAALWRSWGVTPDAVVGHSMGEIAAAHVAGALSLQDAIAVICRRSSLLRRISGQGEMAVVELSLEEAESALRGYEDRVSVAVSNSPRSTVLAGDPAALGEVLSAVEARGVFCRRVKVDFASHSPHVNPLRHELLAALRGLTPTTASVPMRSTVTDAPVLGPELLADYWADNLRQPVRFAQGVQALIADGYGLFIEMSPHPILTTSVDENLRAVAKAGAAVGSLRRGQPERSALLESLGALWVHGHPLACERLFPAGGRAVPLPTYAWQRERYWLDAPDTDASAFGARGHAGGHPLLGAPFEVAMLPGARLWASGLSATAHPWLSDHRVYEAVVLPGAAYVELALAAGAETFGGAPFEVRDVEFERMAVIPLEGAVPVQVGVTLDGADGAVQISCREEGAWHRQARAGLRRVDSATPEGRRVEAPEAVRARCPTALSGAALYEGFAARGLDYGLHFQGVEEIQVGEDEVIGRIRLSEKVRQGGWHLHPALLDACFQVMGCLFQSAAGSSDRGGAAVPVALDRVRLHHRPDAAVWVHGRLRRGENDGPAAGAPALAADLVMVDDHGRLLAEVEGLRVKPIAKTAIPGRDPVAEWLFALGWRPLETPVSAASAPRTQPDAPWLLLVDRSGTGAALAALLAARGARCVVVEHGPGFARLGPDRFQADPADPDAIRAVLRAAFAGGAPCRGAVHLWSLDAAPPEATTPESLDADLTRGSLSALHLAQALLHHGWRDAPRLWLFTRGAQAVRGEGEDGLSVSQAPLWGLGRALSLEHPELGCVRVDLPPAPPARTPDAAEALLSELYAADNEDQVALRPEGRFGARLLRLPAPQPAEPVRLREDATYLITGGLGGLGLSVAAWMVARGARHLTLVGRSGASEAAAAAVAALEAQGARVELVRADVSRREEVAGLLAGIAQRLPPLRGVVHAAGVLEDATVLTLDAARFRAVMGAKVHGAWNLHALTERLPLDFFVLYGSVAGLLGSPGQANYAAANTFLDALAHHRRARGLPSLSLDWGAFSEVGLAAAQDNRGARLVYRGMEGLTPDEGLLALSRLWSRPEAQAGVFKLDIQRWVEFFPTATASPLWEDLRREAEHRRPVARAPGRIRAELDQAAPDARAARLERHLAGVLGQVLRLDPARIDRHAALSSLGLDSLMGLEVRNRLEVDLGERLSATLVFTYPTLVALSEHLVGRLFVVAEERAPERPIEAAPPAAASPGPIADVAEMSEQEVEAELLERFARWLPKENADG